jgi:hypothetical protein
VWSNFAGKLEAADRARQAGARRGVRLVEGRGQGHLTETLGEDALAERGQEFGAAWKSLQKRSCADG